MRHKVSLTFFQDDATGEYGIAPQNSIDRNFNAFWNGIGIFHDVFEHWHEDRHKYFKGDSAFNVSGEMAAMGACLYYYNTLGVYNRMNMSSYRPPTENIIRSALDLSQEAIYSAHCHFGDELISSVPYQRPVYSMDEDSILLEYKKAIQETSYSERNYSTEDERDYSATYKKSCTLRKVLDLYRYGHRMAERLVPDNRENRDTMIEFLDFWNDFTKNNPAEDMYNNFTGIDFTITKKKGIINWKAYLIPRYESKKVNVKNFEAYEYGF